MADPDAYKNDPIYMRLSEYMQPVVDRVVESIRENPEIKMDSLAYQHGSSLKTIGLETLKRFALGE